MWQWRDSYLVISIITLGVMTGASQFLRDLLHRPPSERDPEPGTPSPEQNNDESTVPPPLFWENSLGQVIQVRSEYDLFPDR